MDRSIDRVTMAHSIRLKVAPSLSTVNSGYTVVATLETSEWGSRTAIPVRSGSNRQSLIRSKP